jgi:HD-like signal output (HDOD) protein
MAAASAEETLNIIDDRVKQLGDLPIFSASLNRVRQVSSNPDATAMALSMEALKDANLVTKLLRLANSPYYNRGNGKIKVISRAVVILGFSTIRNLSISLKLVESFQHEHPAIDMNKMLVNSYLAAGFVREVSLKCGIKDVEESYTCALLHNLGEIVIAYFLPEKFTEMKDLYDKEGIPWKDIEQSVLGMSIKEIGQHLATSWEFPSTIVKTMESYDPNQSAVPKNEVQMNRALASLATNVVGSLYHNSHRTKKSFPELLDKVAKTVGLAPSVIENNLIDSFKMSCDLADEYGLKKAMLMPDMEQSEDEFRDRMAGKLSYIASTHRAESGDENKPAQEQSDENLRITTTSGTAAVSAPTAGIDQEPAVDAGLPGQKMLAAKRTSDKPDSPAGQSSLNKQLEIIQEITGLIADSASFIIIFSKVLEGLQQGVGFDRAMLCLLTPDRSRYTARLACGKNADELKKYFKFPVNEDRDIFSQIMINGSELLVEDISDSSWSTMIQGNYYQSVGAKTFIIAAIRSGNKPIGMIYADKLSTSKPISIDEHRGFIQFVAQARLAVQMSRQRRVT